MRTSGALIFHHFPVSKTATPPETAAAPATFQNASWNSPLPYLFGGLAAMVGLIAFAILILACSYWKLSGQVGGGDERNAEGARSAAKCEDTKALPPLEEKFLVIMAGDVKPTFLATPTSSSRTSLSTDDEINVKDDKENEKSKDDGNRTDVIIAVAGDEEEFREL